MNIKTGCEDVNYTELTQDKVQWWAFVNTEMNLKLTNSTEQGPSWEAYNFLGGQEIFCLL
jgi:hypothetical protein